MKKEERLEIISKMVDEKNYVRLVDIVEKLQISDMTVRRDLNELESRGALIRIHGGAKSRNSLKYKEKSHVDKYLINMEAKKIIAEKAVKLIEEGDVIFLGAGTTVELLAKKINHKSLTIVTNCLPTFNSLVEKETETFNVYLLGGKMRKITKSFLGEFVNILIKKMKFNKTFVSANGVKNKDIMTSVFEEGNTQKIALDNSEKKYLLIDDSKINVEDFYVFYSLDKMTGVVTNKEKNDMLNQFAKKVY